MNIESNNLEELNIKNNLPDEIWISEDGRMWFGEVAVKYRSSDSVLYVRSGASQLPATSMLNEVREILLEAIDKLPCDQVVNEGEYGLDEWYSRRRLELITKARTWINASLQPASTMPDDLSTALIALREWRNGGQKPSRLELDLAIAYLEYLGVSRPLEESPPTVLLDAVHEVLDAIYGANISERIPVEYLSKDRIDALHIIIATALRYGESN